MKNALRCRLFQMSFVVYAVYCTACQRNLLVRASICECPVQKTICRQNTLDYFRYACMYVYCQQIARSMLLVCEFEHDQSYTLQVHFIPYVYFCLNL